MLFIISLSAFCFVFCISLFMFYLIVLTIFRGCRSSCNLKKIISVKLLYHCFLLYSSYAQSFEISAQYVPLLFCYSRLLSCLVLTLLVIGCRFQKVYKYVYYKFISITNEGSQGYSIVKNIVFISLTHNGLGAFGCPTLFTFVMSHCYHVFILV